MQTEIPRSLADLKAAAPSAAAMFDALLACDWGRRVGLPGHDDPCPDMAKRRMILHTPSGLEPESAEFRFCLAHLQQVQTLTDPHLAGAVEAGPGAACTAVKINQATGVVTCSRPPHANGPHWDATSDSLWSD